MRYVLLSMSKPAEAWQSDCVTRVLPLRGKDFEVVVSAFMFDYGDGLSADVCFEGPGGKKNERRLPKLLLAPGDTFSSIPAEELNAEIARWAKWLGGRTFAEVQKLSEEELRPFRALGEGELEDAWTAWKAEHDPDPETRIARQKSAIAKVQARFPAFAKHVKATWKLRVPRSLVVVQAFFEAPKRGTMAATVVQESELQPYGVLDRLAERGLARKVRKGKDERCHGRYFRDPPEMLTFAHGGEDGLHFGLWYDRDDRLPAFCVQNYARDSSETWRAGASPMASLVRRMEHRPTVDGPPGFRHRFLLEIMAWFEEAEAAILAKEPVPKVREPRPILGGFGVDAEGRRSACEAIEKIDAALRSDPKLVRRWVDEATRRLEAGDARMALVLGRAMHWMGSDWSKESQALLEGAYRTLGRKALLGITRAHYTHRDAPGVGVLR